MLPCIEKYSGNMRRKLERKWREKLGKTEEKILKVISENKFVTIAELAKTLQVSNTTVENNIAKLKKNGLLKRVGPAKGGHWKIVEK